MKDLNWINAIKAICIITVYLAHAEVYTDYTIITINNVFRPFYVNAFFIVSGYLLFRKQLSQTVVEQGLRDYIGFHGGG